MEEGKLQNWFNCSMKLASS